MQHRQEMKNARKELQETCRSLGRIVGELVPFHRMVRFDSLLRIAGTGSHKQHSMGSSSMGVHMGSHQLVVVVDVQAVEVEYLD